jgi:hypothetical protein
LAFYCPLIAAHRGSNSEIFYEKLAELETYWKRIMSLKKYNVPVVKRNLGILSIFGYFRPDGIMGKCLSRAFQETVI